MQQQSYLLVTNEAVWVTGFFLTKYALGCMSYAREEKLFFRPCIFGKKLFKEYVIINDRHVNFSDLSLVVFLFLLPITPCAKGCLNFERIYFVTLGCVQTDATTPNIVAPTILEVVACVLAVVCKRMQQLPTMLGPAVHRGKDTTHKSL